MSAIEDQIAAIEAAAILVAAQAERDNDHVLRRVHQVLNDARRTLVRVKNRKRLEECIDPILRP